LHRLGEGKLLADLDQVRKVRLTALTPPVCQCRLIEIEIDDCDLCFLAGEESGESRCQARFACTTLPAGYAYRALGLPLMRSTCTLPRKPFL